VPTLDTTPPQKNRRGIWPAIILLLVPAITALVLRAEGRLIICACGKVQLWSGDTCSALNSQQIFDPYSFTHILHGFLLFWLIWLVFRKLSPQWQLALGVVLEALWEMIENTDFVINRYREETAALGYTGDTIVNSMGDLWCAACGFWLALKLGWSRTLIAFLVVEVVLLLWIHDSLLLQILMLIHPVDAIKVWQMCP
jgi:hypothetical protein